MTTATTVFVPLSRIEDSPFQPRQYYDPEAIAKLADDLEANGQLQTPTARLVWRSDARPLLAEDYAEVLEQLGDFEPGDEAGFASLTAQFAFGHRRLRAWRLVWERQDLRAGDLVAGDGVPGLEGVPAWTMPVELAPLSDERMFAVAVAENAKRAGLAAVETAAAMLQAKERFGWTDEKVGDRFGLSRSAVTHKLRLLRLPDDVQAMNRTGALPERTARALIPFYDAVEEHGAVAEAVLDRQGRTVEDVARFAAAADSAEDVQHFVARIVEDVQAEAAFRKRASEPAMFDDDVPDTVEVLADGNTVSSLVYGHFDFHGERYFVVRPYASYTVCNADGRRVARPPFDVSFAGLSFTKPGDALDAARGLLRQAALRLDAPSGEGVLYGYGGRAGEIGDRLVEVASLESRVEGGRTYHLVHSVVVVREDGTFAQSPKFAVVRDDGLVVSASWETAEQAWGRMESVLAQPEHEAGDESLAPETVREAWDLYGGPGSQVRWVTWGGGKKRAHATRGEDQGTTLCGMETHLFADAFHGDRPCADCLAVLESDVDGYDDGGEQLKAIAEGKGLAPFVSEEERAAPERQTEGVGESAEAVAGDTLAEPRPVSRAEALGLPAPALDEPYLWNDDRPRWPDDHEKAGKRILSKEVFEIQERYHLHLLDRYGVEAVSKSSVKEDIVRGARRAVQFTANLRCAYALDHAQLRAFVEWAEDEVPDLTSDTVAYTAYGSDSPVHRIDFGDFWLWKSKEPRAGRFAIEDKSMVWAAAMVLAERTYVCDRGILSSQPPRAESEAPTTLFDDSFDRLAAAFAYHLFYAEMSAPPAEAGEQDVTQSDADVSAVTSDGGEGDLYGEDMGAVERAEPEALRRFLKEPKAGSSFSIGMAARAQRRFAVIQAAAGTDEPTWGRLGARVQHALDAGIDPACVLGDIERAIREMQKGAYASDRSNALFAARGTAMAALPDDDDQTPDSPSQNGQPELALEDPDEAPLNNRENGASDLTPDDDGEEDLEALAAELDERSGEASDDDGYREAALAYEGVASVRVPVNGGEPEEVGVERFFTHRGHQWAVTPSIHPSNTGADLRWDVTFVETGIGSGINAESPDEAEAAGRERIDGLDDEALANAIAVSRKNQGVQNPTAAGIEDAWPDKFPMVHRLEAAGLRSFEALVEDVGRHGDTRMWLEYAIANYAGIGAAHGKRLVAAYEAEVSAREAALASGDGVEATEPALAEVEA